MPFSTFLDGRPPDQLRGLLWMRLSDTGHVLAGSIVDDLGGGGTAVWTQGTALPCRIDPMGGAEELVGGQIDDRSTHVVTLPAGVSLDNDDRFLIDGRGTFEVLAVRERTGEWAHRIEVAAV